MFVFCLYFLFMCTILVNKDVYIGIDSDILCSGITVVSPAATKQPSINLLECKGNYSATYMKLVHWPLMGGLRVLHFVQR